VVDLNDVLELPVITNVPAAIVVVASWIYAPGMQAGPWFGMIEQVSETRINQARGRLPPNSKQIELNKPARGAPEAAKSNGATAAPPTAPVTCNQQNASSPACYSATQQARPIAR
jgi:hypothetical protein